MSHTSQRRGLSPERPGEELIVLAMRPAGFKDDPEAKQAMSELAVKMLAHKPANWISRNFPELRIKKLGAANLVLPWLARLRPEWTRKKLMELTGRLSSVITALYTDPEKVTSLLQELQGEWLERNREKGIPVSIVLSGLFTDVHECCQKSGLREHTYLQTIGTFGRTERLPSPAELELITMCGHGLVSPRLVRELAGKVKEGELSPEEAAHEIAKPCVCGIVNPERAERIFAGIARPG